MANNFRKVNGCYVNTDTISQAWDIGNGKAKVVYTDGRVDYVLNYILDYIGGKDRIIQVIPVAVPTVALFSNGDGSTFMEDIYYLGLCADGDIRPLALEASGFEFVDDLRNFIRLEHKEV